MEVPRKFSIAIGASIWFTSLVLLISSLLSPGSQTAPQGILYSPSQAEAIDTEADHGQVRPQEKRQILHYFFRNATEIRVVLPGVPIRVGDPVFERLADDKWAQAGYVLSCDRADMATAATILWYGTHGDENRRNKASGSSDPHPDETWYYHENRGDILEIIQTLLPIERRARIEQLMREAMDAHADAILAEMTPVVVAGLHASIPVIQSELLASMHRHREEIDAIGSRYEQIVLRERLIPLLRKEVLPIVKKHGQPLAERIGRELWNRASVWRFGWRALYDRTPLPERDLLRREWDRFVEEEAAPVLESYLPEIIEVQKKIFIDVAQNKNVRGQLKDVAIALACDESLKGLVTSVLREAIVENKELRHVWTETLQAEETQAAIRLVSKRVEPLFRQIADELFGTRSEGISPSFARVLRNQVLGKDRRWITVQRAPIINALQARKAPIRVVRSEQWEPFPVDIMVAQNDQSYP